MIGWRRRERRRRQEQAHQDGHRDGLAGRSRLPGPMPAAEATAYERGWIIGIEDRRRWLECLESPGASAAVPGDIWDWEAEWQDGEHE